MIRTLSLALCFALACVAQTPAGPDNATPPAAGGGRGAFGGSGRGGRGGGGGAPARGNNEQEGVDIDRFLGYPVQKTVHLSHGTLLTHSILTAGDPYVPGPNGAVLEYRKLLAAATLLPASETPMSTLPDEYFFYVKSGQGRLDDGKQFWDLHEGIAILAPPNVPHRFINQSSEKPLEMIMLQFSGGPAAHSDLIVRDVPKLPWCEENAHWNNESRCVFGTQDGLLQGERVYLVMLQPWAVSQPHSHTPGTEEIWVKLTDGPAVMLLGSELREMPQDSAYLVPPTGTIDHSNINLSKDKVEWYLYIARGAVAGQGGSPNMTTFTPTRGPNPITAAGGRGGNVNPNLSRDVTVGTVAGKPLK